MSKVRIADMTQAEFAERIRDPMMILIPLGSQEVQGPHVPMGDYRLAEMLAERAAERAGGLVAPVLPFGHADFFRGFAGGIQLGSETFEAVLGDMLTSFLDHGLDRLLIFNGHTTNASLIARVTRRLRRERGVTIPSLNIWQTIPEAVWQEAFGDRYEALRGHGGEPVTSVAMHLAPDLCRPDLVVEPAPRGTAMGLPIRAVSGSTFEGQPVALPLDATEVDPKGLLKGSAARASADAGEILTDHIVGYTVRLMAHLAAADPRNPLETPK